MDHSGDGLLGSYRPAMRLGIVGFFLTIAGLVMMGYAAGRLVLKVVGRRVFTR